MSYAPQAIHSNLSRPHPTDSRLLQNLIKGEKSYIDNLAAASQSGYAAASALAAWGTSEAPDISKAAQQLCEILASVSDAQRTHVQALEGYRSALKDVLDREHSIRSVVRDRDILVGRLIKASKKKVSKKDSGLNQDEKMEKVNAAQRELHACEQVLASEEAALVGVKRRTFKEALTMRMKTMGDAGAAMTEAAKEAILLLDEFDTHGPLLQATGGGQYESMYADDGVERGAYDNQAGDWQQQQSLSQPQQMHADQYAAANGANLVRDEQGQFHKDLQGQHLDPRNPQHFDGASVTPSQSASQIVDHDRSHVPIGQRYTSHFEDVEEQEGVPSDTDSEEDYRRAFVEPRSRMPAPHELGVAADTHDSFIPEGGRNGAVAPPPPHKGADGNQVSMPPVPTAPAFDANNARGYDQGQNAGQPYTPPRYSMSRRSGTSEDGYGHQRRSSNSLIGKMSRLFKTDIRSGQSPDDRPGWNTRTSGNVEEGERRRSGFLRRNEPDSSDEEDTREVFRNVNNARPGYTSNTGSEVGGKGRLSSSASRILPGPKSNRAHDQAQADLIRASVVGGGIGSHQPVASSADSIRSNTTATKKKKKKRPVAGSEIGTAPTRPSASSSNLGDVASLHGNSGEAARPGLSRSSTMKSNSSKIKKNRNSVVGTGLGGGNIFNPNAGKYGADSWIKKPASQMTAYEAVVMAGVVPKSGAPAPKEKPASTSGYAIAAQSAQAQQAAQAPPMNLTPAPAAPTPAPATSTSSRPASIMSSATKNPPLKSALKTPTLSRANSSSSAKGPPVSPSKKSAAAPAAPSSTAPTVPIKSALRHDITQSIRAEPLPQPKMEPIPKAPAPVTSTPLPQEIQSQPAATQQAVAVPQTQAAVSQPPVASNQTAVVEPASTAAPVAVSEQADENATKSPQSVLSIEEDKGFDGTGRLDLGDTTGATEEEASTAVQPTAQQNRAQMPKLDMPASEPFSFSFDGTNKAAGARRGSAITTESAADESVVTPGAEQTYKAYMQQHGQTPTIERSANATPLGASTPTQVDGASRLTDRKVKLEPSRVYGAGGPELSDTSSEEGSAVHRGDNDGNQAEGGAQKAAQVQASSALADPNHTPDPSLQNLSGSGAISGVPAPAGIVNVGTPATHAKPIGLAVPTKAPSEAGSTMSHRKSVRLAPDTKLPPETPTDGDFATPRGTEHGGQDPIAARGSQLSNRIAPPPTASAKPTKEPGPIDLGGRQPTAWTSRTREPDSSDDEVDDDGYSTARKAFGSANRGWAEAMGTSKKSKKAGDGASTRSKTSKKGTASKRASAVGESYADAAAQAAPHQPTVGYVPTAPGSISSTMYSAKAPGSSVGPQASAPSTPMFEAKAPGSSIGAGPVVQTSSMYSATAPGSVMSGSGAAKPAEDPNAAVLNQPSTTLPEVKAPMDANQLPAPLTASNLNALDGNKGGPNMPPVPQAPAVQGQNNGMSLPTAPPPAISGKTSNSGGKGFFKRFKRNK